jgi:hypothetical protein
MQRTRSFANANAAAAAAAAAAHVTVAVLVAMLWAPTLTRASILTFDAKGIVNTRPLPAGYGDNITTTTAALGDAAANSYGLGNGPTPNITADFSPSAPPSIVPPATDNTSSFYYYDDGVTGWPKVAELYTAPLPNGDNINVFTITLTPAPGAEVRINSFDLYDYPNYQAGHTVDWQVLDGSNNVLDSGTEILAATLVSTAAPVIVSMSSLPAGPIRLVLTHTSGHAADLAIDNVNFDQVPEPTALSLLAAAYLLGIRRRRR